MNYWLLKSEPDTFSIDDLAAAPEQTTCWDGVRNYQARNMLRDAMQTGDGVLFYHSNTVEPGVVGVAEIVRAGYPDPTAFDPENKHFDPTSDSDNPRWYAVDVRFVRKLPRTISLRELKEHTETLGDFALLRRGNRLSVMPLTPEQWHYILGLG